MKTIHTIIILILITFLTLSSQESKVTDSTPIIAGKNIAIAQTTSGKVRGYIHNGIYIYKNRRLIQNNKGLAREQYNKKLYFTEPLFAAISKSDPLFSFITVFPVY